MSQTGIYIEADTLDDLLHETFEKLLVLPFEVNTTRGRTCESIGSLLRLRNPRARLSRSEDRGKLFSAFGEFLWYFTKGNELEFIKHFIKRYNKESNDGISVFGGYGPRFFNMHGEHDQIQNVINLLIARPSSRRAVIQLFDAGDISGQIDKHPKNIPCTCFLQFMIRSNKLYLHVSMRSNDAYYGLPHDVFSFTMLQEVIARVLDVELGDYSHSVGSLHMYEDKIKSVKQFLDEGWQSTESPMPAMPKGNPFPEIQKVLTAESRIRRGEIVNPQDFETDTYWSDVICLIQILQLIKINAIDKIGEVLKNVHSRTYESYIKQKIFGSN